MASKSLKPAAAAVMILALFSILALSSVGMSLPRANASDLPMTDPTGDVFDANGRPTTGESYVDITEISLVQQSNNYIGTIKVSGSLPARSASGTYFEWDFLIDADRNPSTSPWSWPLAANDIGVDHRVALFLQDSGLSATICDQTPPKHCRNPLPNVAGNVITLTFTAADIAGSTAFDFTSLARKYVNDNAVALDKAPNSGHYAYQDGTVTLQAIKDGLPTLTTTFQHSTVWYTEGNDQYAKNIGNAFEYAYTQLQSYFPTPPDKFTIYVYHTQADLVQGVVKYSDFSQSDANRFINGGAPRPINNIMHVPPACDWWTITHELTHTYIEKYSGRAFINIKWLDEGLAEYMGWRITAANPAYAAQAEADKQNSWGAFTELKNSNKLYPLSALTTDAQWSSLYGTDSRHIYAEAFVVVSYMASTYGLNTTMPILKKVQAGSNAPDAVQATTGQTETKILDSVKSAPEKAIFVITVPEWPNSMLVPGVALTLTLMVVRRRSAASKDSTARLLDLASKF